MTAPFDDLISLDAWLFDQGIEQAERGISIEDEPLPAPVESLGLPYVYLYATAIIAGEFGNGGLTQFFENPSGILAPCVRDAMREMELRPYATIMARLIKAFGAEYPSRQWLRVDSIDSDTSL